MHRPDLGKVVVVLQFVLQLYYHVLDLEIRYRRDSSFWSKVVIGLVEELAGGRLAILQTGEKDLVEEELVKS